MQITKCEFSNYVCELCNSKLIDFHDFAIFVKRNNDNWNETYNVNMNTPGTISQIVKNEQVLIKNNSIIDSDNNFAVIKNKNSAIQTNIVDSNLIKNGQFFSEKDDGNIVEYFDNINDDSVDRITENSGI